MQVLVVWLPRKAVGSLPPHQNRSLPNSLIPSMNIPTAKLDEDRREHPSVSIGARG